MRDEKGAHRDYEGGSVRDTDQDGPCQSVTLLTWETLKYTVLLLLVKDSGSLDSEVLS